MNAHITQNFIDQWHRVFRENDPSLLLPMIHDDIEFYSPAVFLPKHGKQKVYDTLSLVFGVFKNYRVTDTWSKDNEVMFEFEAEVGKFTLQGIDRFRLDDDGKIIQMKVWIRPLTGLKELAQTVAKAELNNHLTNKSGLDRFAIRSRLRTAGLLKSMREALK